ncbi:hypothetical protein QF049_001325 [Paenibacillus sp. W4I10]|uniref:hypothetical protein n=1 Tax=Paenibacillus sp. W4I10 TaxID=3042298 RepID=UPI00278A2581|nr:hypothetical protein [Paenibacillus sp. W4I10]MDQ0720064.1 hypothetical protein [Paenibacillus sp. W4I10]
MIKAMTTLLASLIFLTACCGESLPKDEPSTSTNTPTQKAAPVTTKSQDKSAKSSPNTSFKAELAIDIESAKDSLKENERPALDVLEKNLTALVQHDHKLYRSGFVDDQLADAMDFYYGEQFQYTFSSIESIEKNASITKQVHITVLGERLDTANHSVEKVKMMYAIRQNEQGDWDIYTID